jgi:hypothetical protein
MLRIAGRFQGIEFAAGRRGALICKESRQDSAG